MSKTLFDLEHNLTEYNELVGTKYSGSSAVLDVLDSYEEPKAEETEINVVLDQYVDAPARTYAPDLSRPINPPIPVAMPKLTPTPQLELTEEVSASEVSDEKQETEEEIESEVGFTSRLKINAVGMVAIVSFIAVTIMVIAFIISNSIAISNTGARIDRLSAQNTEIRQDIAMKQIESNAARNESILDANGYFTPSGNLNQSGIEAGYEKIPAADVIEIPEGKWTVAAPEDASTNFFDAIAKFFNKLFM